MCMRKFWDFFCVTKASVFSVISINCDSEEALEVLRWSDCVCHRRLVHSVSVRYPCLQVCVGVNQCMSGSRL